LTQKRHNILAGIDTNTKLILQGNEYQSEDWLHDATARHIITKVGTAQPNASVKKFGKSSLLLDGNSDYLTIPDSADWDICGSTSDNWTIDLQFKYIDYSTNHSSFISQFENTNNYLSIFGTTSGYLYFQVRSGGVVIINIEMYLGTTLQNTNWNHLAVCKIADEYGVYLNGNQIGYVQDSSTDTFSSVLYIGVNGGGSGRYFNGHMDEIRIQRSNYFNASPNSGKTDTINVPTEKYVADENTKLLLHFNEHIPVQDGSYEILDSSKTFNHTGHVITQLGTAQLSTSQSKFGKTSLLLDGNSDYLTIPDSADWDIGTNLTIDFFVKHSDHSGTECYVEQYTDSTNYWLLEHINGTGLHFQVDGGGADINISGGEISDTDWHHIALIKIGTGVAIYLDGVRVSNGTANCTTSFADLLSIGARIDPTHYFKGHIDELRITDSNPFSADPTSSANITVPTESHTPDSNTKLLLHMDSQDNSFKADLTPKILNFIGTAQIDTAIKRFGSGSYIFDGNSDRIDIADSDDWDICGSTSDNWTIDAHIYNSGGTYFNMYHLDSTTNYWKFDTGNGSTKGLRFLLMIGNVATITLEGNNDILDTEQWYHIALCKVGSLYGLYLDGTQVAFTDDSSTGTISGNLYIGDTGLGNNYFNGNLDGLRIQHSNYFDASPDVGKTDTIDIPYEPYTYEESGLYIPNQTIFIM